MDLVGLEAQAQAVLAPETYALIADVAGRGQTARQNEAAFRRWSLVPRVLRDVSSVEVSGVLQGSSVTAPFGIAPLPRMARVHPDAERALAEAAADLGMVFCAATNSTVVLEELAMDGAPAWFQVYPHSDAGITRDLVHRAAAAGYQAVVITLDRPVPGLKGSEAVKDIDVSSYPNLAPYGDHGVVEGRYNAAFTWRELAELRADCRLPVVLKGILDSEDARMAIEHGCEGIWVSNHGGRQLDQTVASLDALEGIAACVDGHGEVYFDGGVRQGTDILVATALGAKAAFIGRPMAYALAMEGRSGVRGALEQLRIELAHAMALVGASQLDDLTRNRVISQLQHHPPY